jgi:hypothetical protein
MPSHTAKAADPEHGFVVHAPERGSKLVSPKGHRLVDHDLRNPSQAVACRWLNHDPELRRTPDRWSTAIR